jgi:Tfp pilus assembly protein PilV
MNPRRTARGSTLIESMVAMAVLLVGSMGMMGLHAQGLRVESDSRHITRATAIAQDLLSQLELWSYDDVRLKDVKSNLGKVGDPTYALESSENPLTDNLVDHAEAELTAGGAQFHGLPAEAVAGYERYWSVVEDLASDDSNANGVVDGKRVAAVVRWRAGAGWRRVILLGFVRDPAEAR